jgi:hypothetical protein
MVDARFEELDLHESEFVIKPPELFNEVIDEGEGVIVGLLGHVQGREAALQLLSQETPAFFYRPFDA